jgi:hypothetical protein
MTARSAQAPAAADAAIPDVEQIDALVHEFFQCFDNRDGRTPAAVAKTRLYTATAAISVHKGAALELYSPGDFAAPRVQLLTGGTLIGFHEWEVNATTRVLGPLATRVSAYAKAGRLNGVDFTATGTKVFQLVKGGGCWRILALSWFDSESPAAGSPAG